MSNDPIAPRPLPFLADLFIPERTAEIAFWAGLAMGYGRVVINWHCGTGELGIGLARNRLHVVGIDPDPEAIEAARAREKSANANDSLMLMWMCHEPRLVSLPGSADFGVLSGEVLGSYLADDHRLGLLHNLFHHLRPGGAIGLTVPLVPASNAIRSTSISGPLRRLPKGVFARRVSTLHYDPRQTILEGHDDVLIRLPDGGEQRFAETYTRRLYTPDEIFALLRQAGFTSIGMWGGWDTRPLRQAKGWFIARAERPLNRDVGMSQDR